MKRFVNVTLILIIISFLYGNSAFSQELNVIVHRTHIDSTLGSEMVFEFEVINISEAAQTVFAVRTINSLPGNWQSSLCFGDNCLPPEIDSVATTPPLADPLNPGDTLFASLHLAALVNDGSANVQIQTGTLRNSTERTTINFSATTNPISQGEISVVVHRTLIDSTVGSEMVFDFEVINTSDAAQTVFAVRTVNSLPVNWQSSLCFGESCFPPNIDSVATAQPFGDPLEPGDTLFTSLHVAALENDGTANIQIQVGTLRNSTERTIIDFIASAAVSSVTRVGSQADDYNLSQNYPNPFNPSTKISFGIRKAGNVDISVYNVLGNKIITLFNGYKPAGEYSITFDGSNLSSGVYFYKIVSEGFVQTKKMILEK